MHAGCKHFSFHYCFSILPKEQFSPHSPSGDPSLLTILAKQRFCFFILEWYQCNGKQEQHRGTLEEATWWWWCLISGTWNGWIQNQGIQSSRKNDGNKTSTQKLTYMLSISHTSAVSATAAEIIFCSSWDSHSLPESLPMTLKGNLEAAVEPYFGPTLDWGPTQLWPTAICLFALVEEKVQPVPRARHFPHMKLFHRQNECQETADVNL